MGKQQSNDVTGLWTVQFADIAPTTVCKPCCTQFVICDTSTCWQCDYMLYTNCCMTLGYTGSTVALM